MSKFVSLHGHTYYSLLDGISKPANIAKRVASLEMSAIAMTDHGNIGGAVEFTKAIRKVGCKPILGVEAYLARSPINEETAATRKLNGRPYAHLVVLAKNLLGWKQIIKAVSQSWSEQNFYYSPRLNLENFRDYADGGNLISFSGHPGSEMANVFFTSPKNAYNCRESEDEVKLYVDPDWPRRATALAQQYESVFGKGNFFLEVQDLGTMPAASLISQGLRWVSKRTGIPCVATADSHYVDRVDAYDQKTLLCAKLRTTHSAIQARIEADEDIELGGFFRGDAFYIPSYEDMCERHTAEEIAMTVHISDMIEDFSILSEPRLPSFPLCPPGMNEESYLRELCEQGFRDKIQAREGSLSFSVSDYRARLEMELEVINGAGLASYFLIVRHGTNFGKERGWLNGCGRGSAPGCLISYLVDITLIDPLPYGLLFERFYNAGRNSPGRISLPDIDMDFPVHKRDQVFREYQRLFGIDHVAKIATFQSLQGRSAIDEVLSAHGVGFDERKQITKFIPDSARIAEELQDMKDRGDEPSIIQYSLENLGDELAEWVRLEDDGTLSGEYSRYFEQAKRLEGTKKNISTHAAGVVISTQPLAEVCPLNYDKGTKSYIAAMEYPALEAMGLVKLDLLGVAMLSKGEGVRELCLTGEITGS